MDAAALTASSGDAAQARLHSGRGWTPWGERGQWLQVALGSATNITAIAAKGHHRNDWWITRYLLYSSCDEKYWQPYEKVKLNISQLLHVLQAFLVSVNRAHTKSNACSTFETEKRRGTAARFRCHGDAEWGSH